MKPNKRARLSRFAEKMKEATIQEIPKILKETKNILELKYRVSGENGLNKEYLHTERNIGFREWAYGCTNYKEITMKNEK